MLGEFHHAKTIYMTMWLVDGIGRRHKREAFVARKEAVFVITFFVLPPLRPLHLDSRLEIVRDTIAE
jgi:hypothetical protein